MYCVWDDDTVVLSGKSDFYKLKEEFVVSVKIDENCSELNFLKSCFIQFKISITTHLFDFDSVKMHLTVVMI